MNAESYSAVSPVRPADLAAASQTSSSYRGAAGSAALAFAAASAFAFASASAAAFALDAATAAVAAAAADFAFASASASVKDESYSAVSPARPGDSAAASQTALSSSPGVNVESYSVVRPVRPEDLAAASQTALSSSPGVNVESYSVVRPVRPADELASSHPTISSLAALAFAATRGAASSRDAARSSVVKRHSMLPAFPAKRTATPSSLAASLVAAPTQSNASYPARTRSYASARGLPRPRLLVRNRSIAGTFPGHRRQLATGWTRLVCGRCLGEQWQEVEERN